MSANTVLNEKNNEQFSFANLQPETIENILEYLKWDDLKSARLVCRSWYNQTYLTKFTSKLIIKFTTGTFSTSSELMQWYLKHQPNFPAIFLDNVDFSSLDEPEYLELWNRVGPGLELLKIKDCGFLLSRLKVLFCQISNISSLEINGIHSVAQNMANEEEYDYYYFNIEEFEPNTLGEIPVRLKKLKRFVYNYDLILSDQLFESFTKMMPHLEELCIIRRCETPQEDNDISWEKLYEFISRQSGKLKSLVIHGWAVKQESLLQLTSLDDLKLDELDISVNYYYADDDAILSAFLMKQTHIKCLRLNSWAVSDTNFNVICDYLKNLENLTINSYTLTSDVFKSLSKLKKIKDLCLNGTGITFEAIQEGILFADNTLLNSLELSADGCSGIFFENLFHAINLKQLILNNDNSITDHDINLIAKHLVHLEKLIIKRSKFTDQAFIGTENEKNSISNLAKLTELCLYTLGAVTDKSCMEISKLPNLQILNLTGSQITDEGLRLIVKNCIHLKQLRIMDCKNISENGYFMIFENLSRLNHILLDKEQRDVLGIIKPDVIAKHFKNLELNDENHFKLGSQITDEGLRLIVKNCIHLKQLRIMDCKNISENGYFMIFENLSRLNHILLDKEQRDVLGIIKPDVIAKHFKNIVENILDYLNWNDLKMARLVCLSWYNQSCLTKFTSKLIVKFTSGLFSVSAELMKWYLKQRTNYPHILLHHVDFSSLDENEYLDLWTKIGPGLDTLKIVDCGFPLQRLKVLFEKLVNLTSLEIHGIHSVQLENEFLINIEYFEPNTLGDMQVQLKTLKHFIYTYSLVLSDRLFESFTRMMPNLEMLHIIRLCETPLEENDISWTKLYQFIKHQSSKLKSLTIHGWAVKQESLLQLTQLNDFKLNELDISVNYYHADRDEILNGFLMQQSGLKYLRLHSWAVTNSNFEVICNYLKNLETLTIDSFLLTGDVITNLSKLKNLKYLALMGATIPFDSFYKGLLETSNDLITLSISAAGNADAFFNHTMNFSKLKILNVYTCDGQVNDEHINMISKYAHKNLEELGVFYSTFTDKAIIGTKDGNNGISNLQKIKKLWLFNQSGVTNESCQEICKLLQLEILNLGTSKIKGDDITAILKSCIHLKVLRIRDCDEISVNEYIAILKTIKRKDFELLVNPGIFENVVKIYPEAVEYRDCIRAIDRSVW